MATKNFQEMSRDELLEYCREKRREGVPYYTLDHFFKHHKIGPETVKYIVSTLDAEERAENTEDSGPLPQKKKRKNLRWIPPVVQGLVGFACLISGFSLWHNSDQRSLAGLFFLVGIYALFKALKNFIKLD
jgi:hypothetical protein